MPSRLIERAVTRTLLEIIVVGLIVLCKVNYLTGIQLSDTVQDNLVAVMIGTLVMTAQANPAEVLAAFSSVCGRNLILREDGFERAFRDTSTTINASIC